MTIINTIYSKSFADLDDAQKVKAIDIMRELENQDTTPYWSQDLVNNMKERLVDYGINDADIQWQGFCSQGDGASISTDDIQPEKFLRKVKAWSKFRNLRKFINNDSLSLAVSRGNYRYSHEYCVSGEVNVSYYEDVTPRQEAAVEELQSLITEVIRELSRELYKALESENDYHQTDEALTELIDANDYHFQVDAFGEVLKLA